MEEKDIEDIKNNLNDKFYNNQKWNLFSGSYFACSLSLLKEIESNSKRKWLIIPLLYNFKHSIELSIKYLKQELGLFKERDKKNKNDEIHNIDKLFEDILSKYGEIIKTEDDFNKKKIEIDNFMNVMGSGVDDSIKSEFSFSNFKSKIYKMEELIKKYFNINNLGQDDNNTFFRYPESKIDYNEFLNNFNDLKIKDLKFDILELEYFFSLLKLFCLEEAYENTTAKLLRDLIEIDIFKKDMNEWEK